MPSPPPRFSANDASLHLPTGAPCGAGTGGLCVSSAAVLPVPGVFEDRLCVFEHTAWERRHFACESARVSLNLGRPHCVVPAR